MTPETKLKNACIARLRELKRRGLSVHWHKLHGGPMGEAGALDMVICFVGRYLEVELKSERGNLSRLQSRTMDDVRRAGGIAGVVRSVEQLDSLLAGACGTDWVRLAILRRAFLPEPGEDGE